MSAQSSADHISRKKLPRHTVAKTHVSAVGIIQMSCTPTLFKLPRELMTNAKSLAGLLFQCTWQIIPGTVVYVKIPTLAVC